MIRGASSTVRPAILLIAMAALLAAAPGLRAGTPIVVTSSADVGLGTLRQAITDANNAVGLDEIHFNIPGAGPHTITTATELPTITDPVTIDGTTQPGFAGTPRIALTTGVLGQSGLSVAAGGGGSTIRGLAIHSYSIGIRLVQSGNNVIAGNHIGTDPTGMLDLGNIHGIEVFIGANNRIGGTVAADRNLISGNSGNAILISQASGNQVLGNWIGTNVTGEAALPNGGGISIAAAHNTIIGGAAAGAGNVIGASGQGLTVSSANGVVIRGNRIGVSPGGVALPNNFGIDINNSIDPVVGGVGAGNIVSRNNLGMLLNNGVDNAAVLGNTFTHNNDGILINTLQTTDIQIGGIAAGEGNLIAFNTNKGIWNNGLRVTVRGNSFHSNGVLGHDIEGDGVTPNDPGDVDTGANGRQNTPNLLTTGPAFPELLESAGGGSGTRVQGRLLSTPSTTFTLDFYGNPVCSPRPQEFVEAETWLGTFDVTTDGSGIANFDQVIPVDTPVGARIVATATDPAGNTSEFSQRIVFSSFPRSGPAAGGLGVSLTGMQFEPGSTVTVGTTPATSSTFSNPQSMSAVMPALAPGSINGITVATPSGLSGTLPFGWIANFTDSETSIYLSFIVRLVANGLTAGCTGGNYCPDDAVTRAQMAVFLLRGKEGLCYVPAPETGTVFGDVPVGSFAARWIEELAARGVTSGCGGGNYCPNSPVTREQMAVFLLVALEGVSYVPPPCTTPEFADVPCSSGFARWINELVERNITVGCGGGNYCPGDSVTRAQMAVFLCVTFDLPS
jgi:hypothetical protein